MNKIKAAIREYCPIPSLVFFATAVLAFVIWVISEFSVPFSDFWNRYIGSVFRAIPATVTNIFPFSVAECLIIFLPVLFVVLIVHCVKLTGRDMKKAIRYIVTLASVVALFYAMFVFTTAVAYNGSTLAAKLGLERELVSVEDLREAAEYMVDKMNEELDSVKFRYGGSSVMPFSHSEMNDKLLAAYDTVSEQYSFLPRLYSRVKQICLSEPMTYTHISGIYTYYTGEANLNINFPDYNLPFTAAHELAHQRGVLPENEANFVAFLVCAASDDPYIRYSGYVQMYEYLNSALYSADYDTFAEVYTSLDLRVRYEMSSYNKFFEKYRDNVAADVSSTLNDNYLKAQGQTAGEKSYGMVVDLAVAYVKSLQGAEA
ncbi:MAG: DUF3810 domain-containing protein [Clostridia bacterium]|nr:DUF3810 domain-containing protein [Clostridia bacterium]